MKPRKRVLQRRKPSTTNVSPSTPWSANAAIEAARDQKLQELEEFMVKLKNAGSRRRLSEKQQVEAGREIVRLTKEFRDLCTLRSDDAPLSLERAVSIAGVYRAMNWTEEAQKILRSTGRHVGRGRPRTLRTAGLRGLELHLNEPRRWTWTALTDQLCSCGATEHRFQCKENLRREVLLLKQSLAKFGIKLPPPAK
jgi:hypothetical protein